MAGLVWVCAEGQTGVLTGSPIPTGFQAPTCKTGQGVWTESEVSFWEKTIPAEQVGPLIAAIMLCLAVAWLSRFLADEIKR